MLMDGRWTKSDHKSSSEHSSGELKMPFQNSLTGKKKQESKVKFQSLYLSNSLKNGAG